MSAPADGVASRRWPPWPFALAFAALAALQLAAFRWGVILPDTVEQYRQVLSGQYEDWHPPVTAWLWRQLGGARFGAAPLLLLDMLLYWSGFLLVTDMLRRRGHRLAALVPLLIAALPIPFGTIASVLKDSLLDASLVAAVGLIAARGGPGLRLGAAALIVLAAATRFNGAFAGAPLLPLCLAMPPRGKLATALGCVAGIALLFATGTLIDGVALHPRRTQPFLGLVTLDLAGISLASGTDVFPADTAPPPALLASCYTPAIFDAADSDACGSVGDGLRAHLDRTGDSALRLWLGAIAAHPLAYAGHRLAHFNANQRWLERDVPADAIFLMSAANDDGLSYRVTPLARGVYRAAMAMARSPLGRPATWLAVALALLLAGRGLGLSPLARGLALSSLLYGCGYLVVSVAPDLRYNVWTMIAAMLALLLAIAERPARIGRASLGWLALPGLVILGELAAIAFG